MEKEKQHRSTSRSMITTPQECTGEHPRPVLSLLKGLIRRKNNEKTNLSNAETENKLANRHQFAMVPRPEVRYLWYPCGSLGGFCSS